MDKILYGSDGEKILFRYENDFGQVRENLVDFEGVLRNIERRYRDSTSQIIFVSKWKNIWLNNACQTCKGYRLRSETLAVKVDGIAYWGSDGIFD